MNWQHLSAFLWLRWRLSVNQWHRAGRLNAALMIVVAIAAVVTAVPLFVGTFALGLYAIPKAQPAYLLYVWDGVVAAFMLFWGIGLITDLQRSDPLSLSKFLHLPVSANNAFLLNYLSSLLRLSLVVFVPVMAGFALALIYVQGLRQLPAPALVAAFLLMVTALTYQFQGWLASLMSNPRRRRTVIMITTLAFVMVFQLPNLLNVYGPFKATHREAQTAALVHEMTKLNREFQAGAIDAAELRRRQMEVNEKYRLADQQAFRAGVQRLERIVRTANTAVPLGWLPLGVMSSAEGRPIPTLMGLLGMTLIGAASLRMAYRATVGQFQGQATSRKGKPAVVRAAPAAPPPGAIFLEARLPGVSEPVSAIALGTFRSVIRSPEAKMALLSPLIMGVVFGSMLLRGSQNLPTLARPMIATGGMVLVFFGMLHLMSNQFALDRDGFRVFVLSAARRRDILMGKNLAYAPVAMTMAAMLLVAVQIVCPMRIDHLLAAIPQFVSMFLLFCLLADLSSICAPVYLAPGSLNPANPKVLTVLLQLLMFLLVFPLTQSLTLIPLGVEAVFSLLGQSGGLPICLILSVAECGLVLVLYHVTLERLGDLLQAREQRILEIVTNRAA